MRYDYFSDEFRKIIKETEDDLNSRVDKEFVATYINVETPFCGISTKWKVIEHKDVNGIISKFVILRSLEF